MNIQWNRTEVTETKVEGDSVIVRGEFENPKGKGQIWVKFDANGKAIGGEAKEKGGLFHRLFGH